MDSQSPPRPQGGQADQPDLAAILKASRDKLQAVFDTVRDPIVSLTPSGRVESLNKALADLVGRHPRELAGKHYQELSVMAGQAGRPEAEQLHRLVEQALNQGQYRRELLPLGPTPDTRYWEVSFIPVGTEGPRPALTVIQFRNVTEFKRMEAKIRDYNRSLEAEVASRTAELRQAWNDLKQETLALEEANRQLQQLDQLRNDLTEMVVHDMKGPLAEVVGNLDLISYEPLSPTQHEFLDMAVLGGNDLQRMIMNLLEIGRMEEGRLTLNLSAVNFGAMAAAVRDAFKTVIRLKKLDVVIHDLTGRSHYLDQGLIHRVIQNLLTNAIAHTPEGGAITMKARTGEYGGLEFSVADTGEGIPERHRHRLFQKFMQAHSDSRPRTSTGLGLAFCKLAVDAHGGQIRCESREGEGATFYVSLPEPPGSWVEEGEAPQEMEEQERQAAEEGL